MEFSTVRYCYALKKYFQDTKFFASQFVVKVEIDNMIIIWIWTMTSRPSDLSLCDFFMDNLNVIRTEGSNILINVCNCDTQQTKEVDILKTILHKINSTYAIYRFKCIFFKYLFFLRI